MFAVVWETVVYKCRVHITDNTQIFKESTIYLEPDMGQALRCLCLQAL